MIPGQSKKAIMSYAVEIDDATAEPLSGREEFKNIVFYLRELADALEEIETSLPDSIPSVADQHMRRIAKLLKRPFAEP